MDLGFSYQDNHGHLTSDKYPSSPQTAMAEHSDWHREILDRMSQFEWDNLHHKMSIHHHRYRHIHSGIM